MTGPRISKNESKGYDEMENGTYELGTLVWIDFDFPDDEKHTFHPAIVLQDQGDKIAVISGSSNNTPEHLVIRNEQFTSFELDPSHLDDKYDFISHTTYFKLDEVKGIKKNMIGRECGILDSDLLNELMQRCAMKSWFSANSIEDCTIKKWTLICWKDEDDPEKRPYLMLNELNFAIVLAKMKDGRLKILSEILEDEKPVNMILLKEGLPTNDLDEIAFHSKPSFIPRQKICFLIGEIMGDNLTRLKQLPFLRFNSRKESPNPRSSDYKIGDILCSKPVLEIPKMVVGLNPNGIPITVSGLTTRKKKPKYVSRQFKIKGFEQKYNFLLDSKPQATSKLDTLLKIQDSTLTQEEIAYLSQEPSIKLNITEIFNPHNDKLNIGDIVCSVISDWKSIRVPWLIVAGDEYYYYAIEGKTNRFSIKGEYLDLELTGFRSRIYFELTEAIPLNKFKIKFRHDVIPEDLKMRFLSSNVVKSYKSFL